MFVFIVGVLIFVVTMCINYIMNLQNVLTSKTQRFFVDRVGWGTLPPPRKACYHLVACWVQVLRFIRLLGTGVSLGHTERPMACTKSLQGTKFILFSRIDWSLGYHSHFRVMPPPFPKM